MSEKPTPISSASLTSGIYTISLDMDSLPINVAPYTNDVISKTIKIEKGLTTKVELPLVSTVGSVSGVLKISDDFDREFKICSLGGETLITGVSKWCVIDTTTRTLKRTDGVDYVGEYVDQKIYLEPFNKITLPNDMGKKQLTHVVNYSDLDHNWHMNNTNYANLITAVCKNKDFTHFEINFISECMENQEISVYSKEENGEFFVGKVGEKVSFTAYLK